jgi:hypothetical protein
MRSPLGTTPCTAKMSTRPRIPILIVAVFPSRSPRYNHAPIAPELASLTRLGTVASAPPEIGDPVIDQLECGPKHRNTEMVEERGEPLLRSLPCDLSYAFQRLGHAFPVLRPARALLACVPLGPGPWLHQLRCQLSGIVRRLHGCRAGRGGAYRPASARSLKRLVQFSRKPLSYVGRVDWRRLGRIPGTR